MLVLKTTSPSTSPRAPKARPVNTEPSSSASLAMSMGLWFSVRFDSLESSLPDRVHDSIRTGQARGPDDLTSQSTRTKTRGHPRRPHSAATCRRNDKPYDHGEYAAARVTPFELVEEFPF